MKRKQKSRVRIVTGVTLHPQIKAIGHRLASSSGVSFSAYLSTLIAREAQKGGRA